MGNTKQVSPTTRVTVKGQVTLPKAVREAAGIKPGDRVIARANPQGGVLIERAPADQPDPARIEAARKRIEDALAMLDRRGVKFDMTTDEWMAMTRGED